MMLAQRARRDVSLARQYRPSPTRGLMTQIATMQCPHCGAANPVGSQFCQSCGKALPSMAQGGPRIVGSAGFATTSAGQKLQADELHKTAKKASGALLAVAIIQTIVCGVLLAIAGANGRIDVMFANAIFIGMGAIAVIFWGLWGWSRRQPLPAAIVGLVLYATLIAINVVFATRNLGAGGSGSGGFGGIGIGWLDIVIMAVLAQAITAGVKHRQLLRQSSGA
jgi:hypothetical protein